MKYVIISPVKDEESFIPQTLKSVCMQSAKPEKWVIVDDGSTDRTPLIIEEYCSRYDWITLIKLKNYNEKRSGGSKVVNAFNAGYEFIKSIGMEYDFLTKLDGDLTLPPDYFMQISTAFSEDEKLGICGGYILNDFGGKLIREGENDYHIRGAFKSIRKKCFDEIGGFKQIWNWDGLDEMEAMFNGWTTKTLEIPVIHHRPTTSAYNLTRHSFISGREAYREGNNIILALFRSAKLIITLPFIVNSMAYLAGYTAGFIKRDEKYTGKELARYINKFHIKRILKKIIYAGNN